MRELPEAVTGPWLRARPQTGLDRPRMGVAGARSRPLTRKVSKECPELCDVRGEGDICV